MTAHTAASGRDSLLLLVFVAVSLPLIAASETTSAWNDLSEIMARKSYTVTKPMDLLYGGRNLQSELLHFRDVEYGTHVWRVSNSFNSVTYIHNHINRSGWNANGSKIGLISTRCFPPHWCRPDKLAGDPHVFMVNTTGDNLESITTSGCPGCTLDSTRLRHFVWDRSDARYAYFAAKDGVYRYDATPPGQYTKVASLPNTDRSKVMYSYPSEENILMVNDDLGNNYETPLFYFVDLKKPLGSSDQVISYPIAFNPGFPPAHDPAKENSFHDIYFRRSSDGVYTFNYGPGAGLGEPIFYMAPLDGNRLNLKLWYDNTGIGRIPYHSHPAWAPTGRYSAYFGEQYPQGSNKWGWQVANDDTKEHVLQLSRISGGHIAWDGYDPDTLFASVTDSAGNRKLLKASLSAGPDNAVAFVNPFTGLLDDKDGYQTSPRPAQSPDATKILYHSSMTERSDEFVDVYIAVARYPLPPQNVRLVSPASPAIAWEPPQFHRETAGYHVYRAENTAENFGEITEGLVAGTGYTPAGLRENVDYFFALTSVEWSGLESAELSNVIKVRLSGGSYTVTSHEPRGRKSFDRIAPPAPQNLQATSLRAGVNQVTWLASPARDVWYYNIYYSSTGQPEATPGFLIASTPLNKLSYIDWEAKPAAPAHYLVTAVDRQGNESSLGPQQSPPSPPGNLRLQTDGTAASN